MIRRCYILLIFLFFGWSWSFNQSIKAELTPNQVVIGDPVELKIQVTVGNNQFIQWPDARENWLIIAMDDAQNDAQAPQHYLETINSAQIDTISSHADSLNIQWMVKVTAWDSLLAVLPPIQLMIDSTSFSTPPLAFSADLPPLEEGIEMFDIFEVFSDVSAEENPLWYWGGRLALLLLIIGLAFYLFKKFFGKQDSGSTPPQKSLRERTIIALEALVKSKLYSSNLKEYYYELSMILRRFLSEKYGVSYLEMTTYEIKYRLQKQDLTIEKIQQIIGILQQSDLVKFAKNKPSESDVMNQTADVKRLIHEIADLELGEENE